MNKKLEKLNPLSREKMKKIEAGTLNPTMGTCGDEPADLQSVEHCDWNECMTLGYVTGQCSSLTPAHMCDND